MASKHRKTSPSSTSFAQIKIQVLELASSDKSLRATSYEVCAYIILNHLNWKTGTAFIRDADLAQSLGYSVDTVARAIQKIGQSGFLEIKRGQRHRSTEYSLSMRIWQAAILSKTQGGKIAYLSQMPTPQDCGLNPADMPSPTPQICPLIKDNKIETAELAFVPAGSCFTREWEARLEAFGLASAIRELQEVEVQGRRGLYLPDKWPAPNASKEWAEQVQVLRQMLQYQTDETESSHAL